MLSAFVTAGPTYCYRISKTTEGMDGHTDRYSTFIGFPRYYAP
jgi:hypothetical protein